MLIPKNVSAVTNVASREGSRSVLQGVFIERLRDGRCSAVSTNGKLLAQATWHDDQSRDSFPVDEGVNSSPLRGFSAILPCQAIEMASKSVSRVPGKPALENIMIDEHNENGNVVLRSTDLSSWQRQETPTLKGEYPEYNKVGGLGADSAACEFRLSLSVLKLIVKTMDAALKGGLDKNPTIIVRLNDPEKPILFTATPNVPGANQMRIDVLAMPILLVR